MARFDFTSDCAHPKRCRKLMKKFLEDATTLCKEIDLSEGVFGFCTNLENKDKSKIIIEYDYADLNDGAQSKEFCRFFHEKDKVTKGFSELTLSLLHELGHNETVSLVPKKYSREKSLRKIKKQTSDFVELNRLYFNLTDELMATEWAITWLRSKNNRKRAKKFERDFFNAWRGE